MVSTWRRSAILLALLLPMQVGCERGGTATVTVPGNDATPPNALWLQADGPGRQPGKVMLDGTPATMALGEASTISVTASALDSDGGIREVRIFAEVTMLAGPLVAEPIAVATVPGGPGNVVPTTARATTTIDLLSRLGSQQDIVVKLWAEADNFHGGTVRTPALTVPSRMYQLRLLVIALADSDGTAAATVTPADFATLVKRVNRSYTGTMIRFVFDPAADFIEKNSTELNREQATALAAGNAIAAANTGRIPLLLRWGPDPAPTGNGRAAPPLTAPAGHPAAMTWQQDFVWLPNNLNLSMATMLNLGDGSFVAHELGHYLGLYHTFPGWDDVTPFYGAARPATAIAANSAMLTFIGNNGGTVDALDGDRLADTPPDPSLVFYQARGVTPCEGRTITLTGVVAGVNQTVTFSPDVRNVMSYMPTCTKEPDGLESPQLFTEDQIKRMLDTLHSPARQHLLPS